MSKVKLGDVAREHKETLKTDKSEMAIVGLEHLIPGYIRLVNWDTNKENTFTKVFRKGNVLFGRRRAYLKKAVYSEIDGICSGDITVIEAIPGKISPLLLPFIIQNDKLFDYAVGKSAGSLSPRVKWEALKEFEFELPETMSEQEKIAGVLWSMVDTSDKYKDLMQKTDDLVKSQFIEEMSKIEKTKRLGDFIKYKPKSKIKAGNGKASGKYPLFNSSGEQTLWIDEAVYSGESLIIPTGGKAAVHYYNGNCSATTDNFVLSCTSDMRTKFLYLYFISEIEILQKGFKGSGLEHLSKDYLESLMLKLPDFNSQDKLIYLLDQSNKSKFKLENCLQELEKTYKKILKENLEKKED